MYKDYFLRYKNTIIGRFVIYPDGKRVYQPYHTAAASIEYGFGYPLGLYPVKDNSNLLPDRDYIPKEADIDHWIADRVIPKDRHDVDTVLDKMGLNSYDAWEIFIRNKGVTYNDLYWVTDDPNDTFENVHPRAVVNVVASKDKEIVLKKVSVKEATGEPKIPKSTPIRGVVRAVAPSDDIPTSIGMIPPHLATSVVHPSNRHGRYVRIPNGVQLAIQAQQRVLGPYMREISNITGPLNNVSTGISDGLKVARDGMSSGFKSISDALNDPLVSIGFPIRNISGTLSKDYKSIANATADSGKLEARKKTKEPKIRVTKKMKPSNKFE